MNDEAGSLATSLWHAESDAAARRVMSASVEGFRVREGKGETLVLGGLGHGESWPRRADGTPLALLATLDLGMLHPTARGLLQLWCDVEEPGWETDVERDDYVVRVVPSDAEELSVPEYVHIIPRTTSALIETRFAPSPTYIADAGLDEMVWVAYDEWLNALPPGPDHRLFGSPASIQGNVESECPIEDHPWAAPEECWRLLVQLDSDQELGWIWGDMGTLYWMIRDDDWEAGRFDRVFLVMQCC